VVFSRDRLEDSGIAPNARRDGIIVDDLSKNKTVFPA
jgi:hypothetical protein